MVGVVNDLKIEYMTNLDLVTLQNKIDREKIRREDSDGSGRTAADYAIEFGEYLAKAAENHMEAVNALDCESARELAAETYRGLFSAIGEFRTRARRYRDRRA